MSGARFTSAFAADLEAYLVFKQNMGCYGASRIWYLRQFDAWCAEHDRTVFDQGTVEGWVRSRLERSGRYRSWMSYIRDFGRWLQATGHDQACVLSDRWKAPCSPPRPYLLSRQEIDAFFTATARLDTSSPWRWQAAAFFTLMHSCGLRTGEVRALKTGHVDLHSQDIDIVWSKGNRSRRLPVTPRSPMSSPSATPSPVPGSPAGRTSSSPAPATRSPGQRSRTYSPGSGTKPGWPGH